MTEEAQPEKPKSKLDSIIETTSAIKAPRILLYGVSGIGKTTFAATLKDPIFLQTEDGMRSENFEGVPRFPKAASWFAVKEHMQWLLREDHGYRGLVVDSIDWLERLMQRHVAHEKGVEEVGDIPYGAGYRLVLPLMEQFLEACDELQERKNMIICLLGHAAIVRYESPDSEAYDRYRVDLHKLVVPMVEEWCDAMFFVNYKTYIKKTADAGFVKGKNKGIGQGERVVYTQERPSHYAKNHYDMSYELEFSWEAMKKEIFKKKS